MHHGLVLIEDNLGIAIDELRTINEIDLRSDFSPWLVSEKTHIGTKSLNIFKA